MCHDALLRTALRWYLCHNSSLRFPYVGADNSPRIHNPVNVYSTRTSVVASYYHFTPLAPVKMSVYDFYLRKQFTAFGVGIFSTETEGRTIEGTMGEGWGKKGSRPHATKEPGRRSFSSALDAWIQFVGASFGTRNGRRDAAPGRILSGEDEGVARRRSFQPVL
jgi:hypothetical protein